MLSSTECQIVGENMFINKTKDGRNNLCGGVVAQRRIEMKLSQRKLADQLQLHGLDIDKNAVQRIEAGKRFVIDIELVAIAEVLNIDLDKLLYPNKDNK